MTWLKLIFPCTKIKKDADFTYASIPFAFYIPLKETA